MIKLKTLINEAVWDRKFGEPLPTLSSILEKHGGCECESHGGCGCVVNEDIKDVVKAKRSLEKIIKAEGKLRKHMIKLADTMEGHTVNIQLSKQLKRSYKSNVTSFMREVVSMINKMK
mgnify:CR=1 FL=1|jgi:hypothetical protein